MRRTLSIVERVRLAARVAWSIVTDNTLAWVEFDADRMPDETTLHPVHRHYWHDMN